MKSYVVLLQGKTLKIFKGRGAEKRAHAYADKVNVEAWNNRTGLQTGDGVAAARVVAQ